MPGGRPRRREMRSQGRRQWAAWFQRARNGDFIGTGGVTPQPIPVRVVAEALGVGRQYIEKLCSGERGVSPEQAWEIGESFQRLPQHFDRRWVNGILSLAVADEYREHVVGWLGTLLSDPKLRAPFLDTVTLECVCLNIPQQLHGHRPEYMRPQWCMTDFQRHAANKAWNTWYRCGESIERFPPVLQLIMLQLRQVDPYEVGGRSAAIQEVFELAETWLRRQYGIITLGEMKYAGAAVPTVRRYDTQDPARRALRQARTIAAASKGVSRDDFGVADYAWMNGVITDQEFLESQTRALGSLLSFDTRQRYVQLAKRLLNQNA
jgi:hypothetical protein